MQLRDNTGDRPSRLQIDRYLTGELDPAEAEGVRGHLRTDRGARAHANGVLRAKAAVPPLDVEAIRARAGAPAVHAPVAPSPPPANQSLAWLAGMALAIAAVLALMFGVGHDPAEDATAPPGVRARSGSSQLLLFTPEGAYDGRALGEGDQLAVQVLSVDHDRVVVLSVDGTGATTVFYPEEAAATAKLSGSADAQPLPGSITLDGAPGPEVFVAVFGVPTHAAVRAVQQHYGHGGVDALVAWAGVSPIADAVVVERR